MSNDALDSFELPKAVADRGITRRGFLKFCSLMTATLALPATFTPRIAHALATAVRPPVIWLEFQDCTGDTESFLRASQPTIDALLLDLLSVEYHETIMAAAGTYSERSLFDIMEKFPGQYIAIVEGSIPTADGGVYCTIRGQTALSIAQRVLPNALATIAVGSCAWDGGLPGANPNPTGAVGVRSAIPGLSPLISLPGCPVNAANLAATIVHFLTFKQWPLTDNLGRPYFAYGEEIHDECPREDYYERGQFVLQWGDEGHRKGWCLYKMGCRGPRTRSNCPDTRWNGGVNWPIGAGHGCIGCTNPNFWDTMSPFYKQLGGNPPD